MSCQFSYSQIICHWPCGCLNFGLVPTLWNFLLSSQPIVKGKHFYGGDDGRDSYLKGQKAWHSLQVQTIRLIVSSTDQWVETTITFRELISIVQSLEIRFLEYGVQYYIASLFIPTCSINVIWIASPFFWLINNTFILKYEDRLSALRLDLVYSYWASSWPCGIHAALHLYSTHFLDTQSTFTLQLALCKLTPFCCGKESLLYKQGKLKEVWDELWVSCLQSWSIMMVA